MRPDCLANQSTSNTHKFIIKMIRAVVRQCKASTVEQQKYTTGTFIQIQLILSKNLNNKKPKTKTLEKFYNNF